MKPLLRTLCIPAPLSTPQPAFSNAPQAKSRIFQENKGHFNPCFKAGVPSWLGIFSLGTVLKQKVQRSQVVGAGGGREESWFDFESLGRSLKFHNRQGKKKKKGCLLLRSLVFKELETKLPSRIFQFVPWNRKEWPQT